MRAAAVVVEDFPAPPFPRWTKRLAEAHTVGGAGAGYARWQRFLQSGLAAYARDRNDAAIEWPRGVSRLSGYIHHAQVSPFRIAREAEQSGGKGAEKFLDELLIWRELAFNSVAWTLSATDNVSPSRLQVVSGG